MRKALFYGSIAVFFLLFITLVQFRQHYDNQLHVIFCNVGQGDAIFIRTQNRLNILIDGGPGNRVLDCLAKYMPFWDRTIHAVVLTHPHQDHFEGLISVLERYTVLSFYTEEVMNKTDAYKALTDRLKTSSVRATYFYRGDRLKTKDGVVLSALWPTETFLRRVSPNSLIGEKSELASLIMVLSYDSVDFLFPGDSQKEALKDALPKQNSIDILHVPHHGSRTGLGKELVEMIHPRLAVISVGKNKYNHPHPSILALFNSFKIPFKRTDKEGDVHIVSDGKGFRIKKKNFN